MDNVSNDQLKQQQLEEIFVAIQKHKENIQIGLIGLFVCAIGAIINILLGEEEILYLLGCLVGVVLNGLFIMRQTNKLLTQQMLEKAMKLFYWKNDI